MANRQPFSRSVRIEIAKRARNAVGNPICEICGAVGKKLELHHVKQDAMKLDADKAAKKLTTRDGQMLCKPCHDEITKAQALVLARVLRHEARHLGVETKSPRGFPKRAKPERVSDKLPMPPRRPMWITLDNPKGAD